MSAGYQDIFLEQGTSFTTQMVLKYDSGIPYNLSGFTLKSQAKRSYYQANATITFTSTIVDAGNGIIQLSANSAQTSNLKPGRMAYDVIITENVTSFVTRVIEGQIFISPAVTSYR
jgi:hypothetical protein